MTRARSAIWRKRAIWTPLATLIAGAVIGWFAGAGSVDQKISEADVETAYAQGEDSGRVSGEAATKPQIHKAHESGYWEGWEEGLEEGEEEGFGRGQRLGAELATPEGLDFGTRYMVVYEPGQHGPRIKGYLEMPLNTLWECEDLNGCTEIVP